MTLPEAWKAFDAATKAIKALEQARLDQALILKKIHEQLKAIEDDFEERIINLENLYIEKGTGYDQALVKLYARLDKLEKTQMARDDKELANYTRQVTDIDVKVNGMANNIRAYDHRIVEAEAKAAGAEHRAESAVVARLMKRVTNLERQTRYTGAYADAVETFKNGSIKS